MKILGIEHIGIAPPDFEGCIECFESVLGFRCLDRKTVPESGVEVALFDCGGTRIELLRPTAEESPIGGFIAAGGSPIHHLCFDVEGIEEWLGYLSDQGIELIDKKPRRGALGHRIAFLKPRPPCGFLIELSEKTSL
jgi:methylmalonyl-CoA epimerase